ncbi:MAG: ATP-binding protein [Anaerolineae bacterium]|nr:ATP-binding protein [Anaerolineae bacterium]
MVNQYIRRQLFDALKEHLEQKEISFIVGPRQAGKTTLMLRLLELLEARGEKTLFLNLDIEADRQYFASQEQLLRKIRLEFGSSRGYVFIDEIQRKENAGVFLKGIYDMNLPYKLIVSGSGSVELKENIHESLVGRKRIFELSTLSFVEFANHRTSYQYADRLDEFFALESASTQKLLEEYLSFGGYPRVVMADSLAEKRLLIAELYQSYLERDLVYLLGIQKPESITALARLIASQIGQLVSTTELANTLNINMDTVNRYLWYMEKTFILNRVTPFFKNIRKEISKRPVFYFHDLGLRNYALGVFGAPITPTECGFLFQNFVYNLLREKHRNTPYHIHFWRTTHQAEVDFVIDQTTHVIPLEVKYRALTKPELTRSFLSFLAAYHPQRAYVVHLGKEISQWVDHTQVSFIPYYQLLSDALSCV